MPCEAKTIQIDSLRFGDKDLALVGTLEFGQFGVVSHPINVMRVGLALYAWCKVV